MDAFKLREGMLVALKTTLRGNVTYAKTDVAEKVKGTTKVTTWKTDRSIADVAEFEAAKRVRSDAVYTVKKVCSATAFGLLCPKARAEPLATAIASARAKVDAFNAGAKTTRLGFYVITGEIAPDDAETVRAVNAEMLELIDAMREGIFAKDAKAARDAAAKLKQIEPMLELVTCAELRATIAESTVEKPKPPTEDSSLTANEKALAALRKRKREAKEAAAA